MFQKVLVVSVIAFAVMQIAPSLGLFALIGGGIAVAIWDGSDKKKENTAKFGYDPVRQNYADLPAEQKKRVDEIRDEKNIAKDQEIVQICRNQNIPGTFISRLNGDPQYYPSLKQLEPFASTLPSHLSNKLMNAARSESREWTKKKNLYIREDNWQEARNYLVSVVQECNSYGQPKAEPAKQIEEKPKADPRPFKAYNDELFN